MSKEIKNNPNMPLTKKNYLVIIGSVVVLAIGFILLSGGASENPIEEFNYDMFSVRRIIIAPLVMLAGFAGVGLGIMYKFKEKED